MAQVCGFDDTMAGAVENAYANVGHLEFDATRGKLAGVKIGDGAVIGAAASPANSPFA